MSIINNSLNIEICYKLLEERIIFLTGIIEDDIATTICAQLLYLESLDSKEEISIYINSPGGIISSGMAIYDTIQIIKPNVCTLCIGQASSMASLILASGTKGKRYCTINSNIMLHQPSAGFYGQASDLERHTLNILKIKRNITKIYMKHCSKSLLEVQNVLDRDYFMSAYEALTWGIIDKIIYKRYNG